MKRIFDKLIEKDLIERIPELKGNPTTMKDGSKLVFEGVAKRK